MTTSYLASARPRASQGHAVLFVLAWLAVGAGCVPADDGNRDLLKQAADDLARDLQRPNAAPDGGDRPDRVAQSDAGRKLFGFACKSPNEGPYHPPGYADSALHGSDFKLQREACRNCHGQQLEGCDFAGGCDNCHDGGHPDGWRENCIYCHGGDNNPTGAPPSDLVRGKPPSALSFLVHDAHVVGTLHAPYDCNQCHLKPKDLLSPGHAFDDTPGKVEVSFAAGLSQNAKYEGGGACSNVYCHGNRRQNGAVKHTDSASDCNSCHGFDDAKKLSGRHDAHINGGLLAFAFDRVACNECHTNVIAKDGSILEPALHVNGKVDLALEAQGITYDGTRCNGTCHGAPHTFISTWQP